MRITTVARWARRITLLKASTIGIIVTSLLSASIVLVTLYGDKTGNYVIGISDESYYGLTLFEQEQDDFFAQDGTTILTPTGLNRMTNETYTNIPTDVATYTGGSHNLYDEVIGDGRFLIYTFYLVNMSSQATPYFTNIYFKGAYLPAHEALRIMVITQSQTRELTAQYIYSYPDENGNPDDTYGDGYTIPGYTTKAWSDAENGIVCSEIGTLNYREVVKITLVMWLEGWDDQCVDEIKGGRLKFEMSFSVNGNTQTED